MCVAVIIGSSHTICWWHKIFDCVNASNMSAATRYLYLCLPLFRNVMSPYFSLYNLFSATWRVVYDHIGHQLWITHTTRLGGPWIIILARRHPLTKKKKQEKKTSFRVVVGKNDQKMSSTSTNQSYVRIVSELLPLRVTYDAASASQLLCTIEKWFLQDDKRLI